MARWEDGFATCVRACGKDSTVSRRHHKDSTDAYVGCSRTHLGQGDGVVFHTPTALPSAFQSSCDLVPETNAPRRRHVSLTA